MRTSRTIQDAVLQVADALLHFARARTVPLFVDCLDAQSLSWRRYDVADVAPGYFLSNVAAQQVFLRFLVGVSILTGRPTYERAARETMAFVLERLTDHQGLPFWGGHVAFDLESLRPVASRQKGPAHELKSTYPYFELMWAVDAERTKRLVESFWNAHVKDWSNLDFDRHGRYGAPRGPLWDSAYRGGDIGFWGQGLTFVNAGSDLYYAAGFLAKQTSNDRVLEWAKRLAGRYVQTRCPSVGISAYQYSQKAEAHCNGPAVRGDRARYQFAPVIPSAHIVLESALFRPRPVVQRALLRLGEILGPRGSIFMDWAREELEAWATHAYRTRDNVFLPMLTDGHVLEGLVLPFDGYFGPRGHVLRAIEGDADFFWTYANGWRLTASEPLWQMTRALARGLGFGDIGTPGGCARCLQPPPSNQVDYRTVFGLLELHRATQAEAFLSLARELAECLVSSISEPGVFSTRNTILVSDPRPMALLAVAAALQGQSDTLPHYLGSDVGRSW